MSSFLKVNFDSKVKKLRLRSLNAGCLAPESLISLNVTVSGKIEGLQYVRTYGCGLSSVAKSAHDFN